MPYFIKSENQERGKNAYHGDNGPLSVSDPRIKLDLLEKFMDAAEEKGIPKIDDFNKGDNFGCGYFQVTQKNGLRCSAAVGYLNPIKKRKNLKIETNCHVKKINFDGTKAVSVSFWKGNETNIVSANKEILLSAGSIGSTQILQTSGIGNSTKLSNLGINIIKDLKGVGQNLQDHLMFRPVYKLSLIHI